MNKLLIASLLVAHSTIIAANELNVETRSQTYYDTDEQVSYDIPEDEPLRVYVYSGNRAPSDAVEETGTIRTIYTDPSTSDITTSLENIPGVNVFRTGPKGQLSSLFTRGTDSNHTLLTLNGIAIRDESTVSGAEDIGQHSMVGISSVDVVLGPMGAMYGPNAIAGSVNFSSQPVLGNYVQQTYSSNEQYNTRVKIGEEVLDGRTTLDVQGEYETRKDGSVYSNGTEEDPFTSDNFSIAQDTILGDGWSFYTGYLYKNNNSNIDGSGGDVLDYTSNWNWRNFNTSLYSDATRLSFNNSQHDRSYEKPAGTDVYESTTNTVLAQHTVDLNEKSDVTVGYEYQNTDATLNTDSSFWKASADGSRINRAYYIQPTYSFSEDFIISGTLRYDTNTMFSDELTTRIGVYLNGFRASAANGFRVPTFYEMNGSDNFGFVGNTDLRPETSKSYEIGYNNDWLDVALFMITTNNAITYEYDPITFSSTYQNDTNGEQESKGVEVTISHDFDLFKISNSLAIVESELSDGSAKLRRPRVQNVVALSVPINDDIMIGSQIKYTSDYEDINGTTFDQFTASSVTTVDVDVKYQPTNQIILFGELNNITDEQYERPSGFKQPGRNFMIGARYTF